MARAILSPLFDYFRGKFGGAVFSKNTAGEYFKDFVIPANPQTATQVNIRTIFGNIAGLWNSLSVANRDLWSTFANNGYKPLDRYFLTARYTGRQAYSALAIAVAWFLDWKTDHATTTEAWTVAGAPATEAFLTPAVVSTPPTALTGSKTLAIANDEFIINSFTISTNSTTHRAITVTLDHNILAATYTGDDALISGSKGSFGVYLSKQIPVDGYKVTQKFVTKWFQGTPLNTWGGTVSAPGATIIIDYTGTFVKITGWYYCTLVWLTADGQQIELISDWIQLT